MMYEGFDSLLQSGSMRTKRKVERMSDLRLIPRRKKDEKSKEGKRKTRERVMTTYN